MKKIISIVGARPQFIKAVLVERELAKFSEITSVLVHTGQHYDYDMSGSFFDELGLKRPEYNLGIGSMSAAEMVAKQMLGLVDVFDKEQPDMALVYGDTNSTLAGALTAKKMSVPLAHVEAGLRSYDRSMPEEENRVLTDYLSSVLLCPSNVAVENLRNEDITHCENRQVHVVGDVMKDLALQVVRENASLKLSVENFDPDQDDYLVLTVHRDSNTNSVERLRQILRVIERLTSTHKVVFPIHPRTSSMLKSFGIEGELTRLEEKGLVLCDPLPYKELMALLRNALCVVTDSGGLQKEAAYLQKPCIVLRDTTEWKELVEEKLCVLVGVDSDKASAALKRFANVDIDWPQGLYGDGNATSQIVKVILDYVSKN